MTPRSAGAGRVRVTDATEQLRAITEAQLQRAVIDLARTLGWGVTQSAAKTIAARAAQYGLPPEPLDGLIFHPRYSLGSEPGWPDLTLIRRRDRRLVFAELKSERGVLGPRQVEVLELLGALAVTWDRAASPDLTRFTQVEVSVWRPSDLQSGLIAEVLR